MEENTRVCDICGTELEDGEGTWVDDQFLCHECVDEHYTTCDHCGETIWINDKIEKLSKAQDNLLGMLEDGRASDTIMNRIASNESELAALTEQLESKSKEVAAVDDEMYNELVNRFVSYMGSNMTPQALDLRNAAIDHIEVDSEQTTIYFNSGIGIDAATKEYFDNEKNWEASK